MLNFTDALYSLTSLPFSFFWQGHQESREQDPQDLLAPLGLVALQVARACLEWGDRQDPLDTATPRSVLASLTTDKDTQVPTSV